MAKSEKQKMLAGELYAAWDAELVADRARAAKLLARFNASEPDGRDAILRDLLGGCGEGVVVRPTFQCDYGYNIHLERGVFLNFNCVLLDVMPIRVGEGTQIGPAVQIYAADHPGTARLGWRVLNAASRSRLAKTSGLAAGPFCFRASRWETTP